MSPCDLIMKQPKERTPSVDPSLNVLCDLSQEVSSRGLRRDNIQSEKSFNWMLPTYVTTTAIESSSQAMSSYFAKTDSSNKYQTEAAVYADAATEEEICFPCNRFAQLDLNGRHDDYARKVRRWEKSKIGTEFPALTLCERFGNTDESSQEKKLGEPRDNINANQEKVVDERGSHLVCPVTACAVPEVPVRNGPCEASVTETKVKWKAKLSQDLTKVGNALKLKAKVQDNGAVETSGLDDTGSGVKKVQSKLSGQVKSLFQKDSKPGSIGSANEEQGSVAKSEPNQSKPKLKDHWNSLFSKKGKNAKSMGAGKECSESATLKREIVNDSENVPNATHVDEPPRVLDSKDASAAAFENCESKYAIGAASVGNNENAPLGVETLPPVSKCSNVELQLKAVQEELELTKQVSELNIQELGLTRQELDMTKQELDMTKQELELMRREVEAVNSRSEVSGPIIEVVVLDIDAIDSEVEASGPECELICLECELVCSECELFCSECELFCSECELFCPECELACLETKAIGLANEALSPENVVADTTSQIAELTTVAPPSKPTTPETSIRGENPKLVKFLMKINRASKKTARAIDTALDSATADYEDIYPSDVTSKSRCENETATADVTEVCKKGKHEDQNEKKRTTMTSNEKQAAVTESAHDDGVAVGEHEPLSIEEEAIKAVEGAQPVLSPQFPSGDKPFFGIDLASDETAVPKKSKFCRKLCGYLKTESKFNHKAKKASHVSFEEEPRVKRETRGTTGEAASSVSQIESGNVVQIARHPVEVPEACGVEEPEISTSEEPDDSIAEAEEAQTVSVYSTDQSSVEGSSPDSKTSEDERENSNTKIEIDAGDDDVDDSDIENLASYCPPSSDGILEIDPFTGQYFGRRGFLDDYFQPRSCDLRRPWGGYFSWLRRWFPHESKEHSSTKRLCKTAAPPLKNAPKAGAWAFSSERGWHRVTDDDEVE
ncbi:hypothetical protein KGF57_004974 [Candida theae]|uniref:Uncharacterized protein n=1 Tax=Candida theae TaxID=1198502 RepID=A0AAD5BBB0_9ASCO|nr:uncharacterized protein KGF57_004974 [Candida theae]KAI5949144.1 hypothetical protein KGF57_004974 [Candida theae]